MAKSNDTTYYPNATAKCTNCGSTYTLGSTLQTLSVEICGNCHPFYTGKAVLVDTAGRIDKFNTRMEKKTDTTKVVKSKTRKQVQSLSDLMTEEPTEEVKPTKAKEPKTPVATPVPASDETTPVATTETVE